MKPMKKRMLQDHTIQDALAFWQLLRRGRFRPLLAEPTENTIIQLFRYVITGASSFLVDFLLLFLLELASMYYENRAMGFSGTYQAAAQTNAQAMIDAFVLQLRYAENAEEVT